ncbi:hypothetical protein N9K98_02310 [Luminiphilus sp.]|nr:hypothetical protein [Luminiphilus sp.]
MKLISTQRYSIYRQEETDTFHLMFVQDNRTEQKEFILQAKNAKHRANHRSVIILDDDGNSIERRAIDEKIASFIFKHFYKRGDTESFCIYENDLESGEFDSARQRSNRPIAVRHQLTDSERSFTSNGAKLWYHKPIFDKLRDTGYGSIVRATMTLHQVCASNCQFCSTISRNRKDTTTFEEAKAFVDDLYYRQAEYNKEHFAGHNEAYKQATGSDIRLRGLILSGGGQPNLWPHFTQFVEYLSTLDIDLGLITNGFPKSIPEEVYKHFTWIRISITPEDASPFYPDQRFDLQYLPNTIKNQPDITVGYSYVFGPWTNDDILKRIDQSIQDTGFSYCRTLTDCNLTRDMQLLAHKELAERLHMLDFIDDGGNPTRKIFHQFKFHGDAAEAEELWDNGQCFLQAYNVFWDTTGHEQQGYSSCYACDSVTVLTAEDEGGDVSSSERRFNHEKWGTVKNTEVSKLYNEPLKPFFDPREVCTSCLFTKNNRVVKEMIQANASKDYPAISPSIQHLNFP